VHSCACRSAESDLARAGNEDQIGRLTRRLGHCSVSAPCSGGKKAPARCAVCNRRLTHGLAVHYYSASAPGKDIQDGMKGAAGHTGCMHGV
jgi:hypothetical protein